MEHRKGSASAMEASGSSDAAADAAGALLGMFSTTEYCTKATKRQQQLMEKTTKLVQKATRHASTKAATAAGEGGRYTAGRLGAQERRTSAAASNSPSNSPPRKKRGMTASAALAAAAEAKLEACLGKLEAQLGDEENDKPASNQSTKKVGPLSSTRTVPPQIRCPRLW